MTERYAHLCERGLTQESVFRGKLLRIRVDTVALPNGEMATREIVEHPGAAAVVPMSDDGQVLLVRQYRYPIDAVTLEVPCGKLEYTGENVGETARRELKEETGCSGGELTYLGRMHSAPGFTNEVIHIFAARGFSAGEACADPDEFLEPVWLPIPEAMAMIRRGEITDAKTIMGLLWTQQFGLASEQQPPKGGTLEEPEAS